MSVDLHKIWQTLADEKLDKPLGGEIFLPKRSKHPVQKLKNGYLLSIGFSITFLIGFVILFFVFREMVVKASLGLVIASYIFFLVTNFSMYRKIKTQLPVDQSLRITLTHTVDFVSSNIRFQERVALFIYPVAATSGFLMGGATSGDITNMLQQRALILLWLGAIIVLTPLCYLLAHWMYKISYQRWLSELRVLIAELETSG